MEPDQIVGQDPASNFPGLAEYIKALASQGSDHTDTKRLIDQRINEARSAGYSEQEIRAILGQLPSDYQKSVEDLHTASPESKGFLRGTLKAAGDAVVTSPMTAALSMLGAAKGKVGEFFSGFKDPTMLPSNIPSFTEMISTKGIKRDPESQTPINPQHEGSISEVLSGLGHAAQFGLASPLTGAAELPIESAIRRATASGGAPRLIKAQKGLSPEGDTHTYEVPLAAKEPVYTAKYKTPTPRDEPYPGSTIPKKPTVGEAPGGHLAPGGEELSIEAQAMQEASPLTREEQLDAAREELYKTAKIKVPKDTPQETVNEIAKVLSENKEKLPPGTVATGITPEGEVTITQDPIEVAKATKRGRPRTRVQAPSFTDEQAIAAAARRLARTQGISEALATKQAKKMDILKARELAADEVKEFATETGERTGLKGRPKEKEKLKYVRSEKLLGAQPAPSEEAGLFGETQAEGGILRAAQSASKTKLKDLERLGAGAYKPPAEPAPAVTLKTLRSDGAKKGFDISYDPEKKEFRTVALGGGTETFKTLDEVEGFLNVKPKVQVDPIHVAEC